MLRPVPTRWNTFAEALTRALELQAAIDKLVSLPKHVKSGKKGVGRFKLTSKEWLLLKQLNPILEVCTLLSMPGTSFLLMFSHVGLPGSDVSHLKIGDSSCPSRHSLYRLSHHSNGRCNRQSEASHACAACGGMRPCHAPQILQPHGRVHCVSNCNV